MSFIRYPHLEKFGNRGVENIEFGVTHIFPKLDGTNASVWCTEWNLEEGCCALAAGSRNRELSLEKDNAGFYAYVQDQSNSLWKFYENIEHIRLVLYGEWLVPHTVKNYRESAWRKFYVFDVFDTTTEKFLPYEQYQPLMEHYGLDYIPCIKMFKNGSWENFLHEAKNCKYLLADGDDPDSHGEGIVIKNYNWVNSHNEVTWAKIVLSEFKDKHVAAMGVGVLDNKTNAQVICDKACTAALIEKEFAKIVNEKDGWSSHYIPRLLHTVFYCVVKEELWDCLKEIKYGLVNFKELQQLCILKVKETKPELF